jgi:hypothetical protein
MSSKALLDPVRETDVPKVDNAIAVGEDLKFQERWWTLERIVWSFFVLILIADVLGVFGEGWLAKTQINQPGSGMFVKYDRVQRTGTPSKVAIQFGPDAVVDGKVRLFASDSIVKDLGAQRVIPQPETSAVAQNGLIYTFPSGNPPGEVDFELQPGFPGVRTFRLQVIGKPAISARVVVMP